MMKMLIKSVVSLFLSANLIAALAPDVTGPSLSRRQTISGVGAAIVAATATTMSPASSWAVIDEETPRVTTRLGGLLEPYQDGPRGIRIMAPSGWNRFEGEVGAFDLKWSDLVDPNENIKISSTPVKSNITSVAALGEVEALGKSLASKRNANLVKAKERLTDGILFYQFEFAINDGTHQLLGLCICKSKLWSIDAGSLERRWGKRSEIYENVLGSFMPKLG